MATWNGPDRETPPGAHSLLKFPPFVGRLDPVILPHQYRTAEEIKVAVSDPVKFGVLLLTGILPLSAASQLCSDIAGFQECRLL